MKVIKNDSGEIITNSNGELITSLSDTLRVTSSEFEASLRYFSETRRAAMIRLHQLNDRLQGLELYDNLTLWLILPYKNDCLKEWKSGTAMTASGDYTFSTSGITGGGTESFNTDFNPSTDIDSINNWSFGIYSQTNSAATTYDMGVSIGANEHYIRLNDELNNLVVKNGTTSISTSIANTQGHFINSVQDGTVKAYWNGVEQGTSAAVGGSLANGRIYLSALNDDGTATGESSRVLSLAWIYNGELNDGKIETIHRLVMSIHTLYNRLI